MTYQPSIRLRLTLWYTAALAAGLSAFGAGIWLSMRARLVSELNATLVDRTRKTISFLNYEMAEHRGARMPEELEEFSQGLPLGIWIEVRDGSGAFIFAPGARAARGGLAHSERAEIAGSAFDIRATGSLEPIAATLRQLELLLLASTPLVVLIAAIGGYWLSRRALRPVDAITHAARSIGIANLSQRLRVPATGDELQRLSETWNGMLARLEAAVNRLTQFTADASHELRTPLAVIRATAEIALRKSRSPEAYRASLEEVVAETGRMAQLVEDLLFLARDESAHPRTAVDLASIVEEACVAMEGVAAARNIGIARTLAPAPLLGSAPALRRLALVLLDNAIKYSHPDSIVHVATGSSGLMVKDTGIGIAPESLPFIFERFYQADPARSDRGYGLGLAQAQTIAARHCATIEVFSAPGMGSTFHVVFPAGQPPHEGHPAPERVARLASQS